MGKNEARHILKFFLTFNFLVGKKGEQVNCPGVLYISSVKDISLIMTYISPFLTGVELMSAMF